MTISETEMNRFSSTGACCLAWLCAAPPLALLPLRLRLLTLGACPKIRVTYNYIIRRKNKSSQSQMPVLSGRNKMTQKLIIWAAPPFTGQDNRGFTLVELMVAMAISSIIMASIYLAYTSQQKVYTIQNAVVEMQQNIRSALLVMGDELRMAGYDPNQLGTAGITSASATTLTFTLVADNDTEDNDNDGTTDEPGELKTVTYDLYDAYNDGINDIGRQIGAAPSTKRALAENIENLEFSYILADNSTTTAPSTSDLKKIRSVRISILARSIRQDRDSINNTVYTRGSGLTWGPFGDRIRRRLLVETINCRNLGL